MHLDSDGHFASRSVKLLPAVEAELPEALATAGSKLGSYGQPSAAETPLQYVMVSVMRRLGKGVSTITLVAHF
jgi:hypothetical protein